MFPKFSRVIAASSISVGAIVGTRAADFNWTGGCGSNGWYEVCTGAQCSGDPLLYWRTNNWGLTECGTTPPFPGAADDVYIFSLARLGQSPATVNNVYISGISELSVQDGGQLSVGPLIQNDGLLYLRWGGWAGAGHLICTGLTDLVGSGALVGENGFIEGAGTLRIGEEQTVRGGTLTISAGFDNAGVVKADDGQAMSLTGAAKSNSGTLSAQAGSLNIHTSITQASSGRLFADGGTVRLRNGAAITGGTFESTGASQVNVDQDTATVNDVLNRGSLSVGNGGVIGLNGTAFTNNGTISIYWGGWGGRGTVRIDDPITLAGTGVLLFTNGALDGVQVTNAVTHTIRGGTGELNAPIVNLGTINADVAGQALTLRDQGKINRGLIKASNSGYLDIQTSISQPNDEGLILADNGTVRFFNGSAVTGGRLSTSGSGICQADQNAVILTNITNQGALQVGNGGTLIARGTGLTNTGRINVYYGGWAGRGNLQFDDPLTISGAGEIVFTDGVLNGQQVTQVAEHTIRGGNGELNAPIVNFGTIHADALGQSLALRAEPKINRGLFKASNSGYLDIYTAIHQPNDEGQIVAENATVRLYHGTAFVGGTLSTTGTGLVQADNNTFTVTDITNQGALHVGNGGLMILNGAKLENRGEITLYYGGWGGPGTMRFDDDILISGPGEVILTNGYLNGDTGRFINAADHVIRGCCTDFNVAFINLGTVRAETGGELRFVSHPKFNEALIESTSGGAVHIFVPITQTATGRIVANDANVLLRDGAVVNGGALDSAGSGACYIDLSAVTLNSITNRGALAIGNGGSAIVTGPTLFNDGAIRVYYGGWGGNGHIRMDSDLLLSGTGSLALNQGDIGPSSPGTTTLTNGPQHTISGAGPISAAFVNGGTVNPGNPHAAMTAQFGYTQTATGRLLIELGGAPPDAYDRLLVNGAAQLDGELRIVSALGFNPAAGQSYTVLTATTREGEFTAITGPGRFDVSYTPTSVVVTIVNPAGDMNCDGVLSVSDIAPFVLALTNPQQYAIQFPACDINLGDMNEDDQVSVSDISFFVRALVGS